jgi:tRNA-2-methylthio-N6-dimethylallyladenosine synthase
MDPLYSNDIAFELNKKSVNEKRQGEAMSATIKSDVVQNGKNYYIESYGCQMNFNDSEIVASVLTNTGYSLTENHENADVILINTCSIRDKAEQTIRLRLKQLNLVKKKRPGTIVGLLGCMAERLKEQLLVEEKLVDIVAGPDSYRDLPILLNDAEGGQKGVNVLLSREETYGDINPVRLVSNGVSAFVSITRGCDNMCAFCVVPFTRGRERSRSHLSILDEVRDLYSKGFKEVTLLGQNVDSYRFTEDKKLTGKKLVEAKFEEEVINFSKLLELVAQVAPDLRVRFSTSHPKDMSDDVMQVIARYENICKHIHLPVQSGSTTVLDRMNRTYSREWYLDRVAAIRRIIPGASLSTDIITGFCGETEEEHQDTLSLFKLVRFDMAYLYYYSERPGTLAAKKYEDDVPLEDKKRRLNDIILIHRANALALNEAEVGKRHTILLEGISKKREDQIYGRTDNNKVVIVDRENLQMGTYLTVDITGCSSAVLLGKRV